MADGMVAQSVLDLTKHDIERHFGVEVEAVAHVGSKVPPAGQPPLIPPIAWVRVDWRKGDERGWQIVEVVGEEIYG